MRQSDYHTLLKTSSLQIQSCDVVHGFYSFGYNPYNSEKWLQMVANAITNSNKIC